MMINKGYLMLLIVFFTIGCARENANVPNSNDELAEQNDNPAIVFADETDQITDKRAVMWTRAYKDAEIGEVSWMLVQIDLAPNEDPAAFIILRTRDNELRGARDVLYGGIYSHSSPYKFVFKDGTVVSGTLFNNKSMSYQSRPDWIENSISQWLFYGQIIHADNDLFTCATRMENGDKLLLRLAGHANLSAIDVAPNKVADLVSMLQAANGWLEENQPEFMANATTQKALDHQSGKQAAWYALSNAKQNYRQARNDYDTVQNMYGNDIYAPREMVANSERAHGRAMSELREAQQAHETFLSGAELNQSQLDYKKFLYGFENASRFRSGTNFDNKQDTDPYEYSTGLENL